MTGSKNKKNREGFFAFVGIALSCSATSLLLSGCGKSGPTNELGHAGRIEDASQSISEQKGGSSTFSTPIKEEQIGNDFTPDIQIHEEPLPPPAPSGLRLTAIMSAGEGELRAGFVLENNSSRVVKAGDVVNGYVVDFIDPQSESVVLMRENTRYMVALKGVMEAADNTPPEMPGFGEITNFTEASLNSLPRERFEPTEDEKRRGIDPNDYGTWPKDYRGPAIERAIKSQSGR
jgi:hypothetical protein